MPIYTKDEGIWKPILIDDFVNDYSLWSWGDNNAGQLALNDTISRSVPTQVSAHSDRPESWKDIVGWTIAIKTDGTLWGWGNNGYGSIGDNTTQHRSLPVRIGEFSDWEQIEGISNRYGIRSNGELYSWGWNEYGQLGHGDTINRSVPTRVGTASNWKMISNSSHQHFFAMNSANQVYSCGRNDYGQLGLNHTNDRSSLTLVGTIDCKEISLGVLFTIILRSDNRLYSCGADNFGQLGSNTSNISKSVLTQIGSQTDWKTISSGGYHISALKNNGTLWSWGRNFEGQLGHNNIIYRSVPVQVGSLSDWFKIQNNVHSSFAIRTTGELYSCGRNLNGQLGHNDIIDRSVLTRIGTGTNWRNIFGNYTLIFGLRYK
jgi:alpha-tubulin suppressor-like RCC1 family protein